MRGLSSGRGISRISRRALLRAGAGAALVAGWRRPAAAIGERSLFRFARAVLPGLPDPRPTALARLAWEVVRRTSVQTTSDPVQLRLGDPNLFHHPFLVLSGDRSFALPSDGDIARLRRYITYGGFLLIDSSEGRAGGGFDEAATVSLPVVRDPQQKNQDQAG